MGNAPKTHIAMGKVHRTTPQKWHGYASVRLVPEYVKLSRFHLENKSLKLYLLVI